MAQFQITFRGMGPSDALRSVAEEKFAKCSERLGRGAGCSIVVDQEAGRGRGPRLFSARVQLHAGVQGQHITAAAENENASAAVALAFERALTQATTARRSAQRARPLANALVLVR